MASEFWRGFDFCRGLFYRTKLFSNGADVEVLRLAWFREEVKNVVTKMMDIYV